MALIPAHDLSEAAEQRERHEIEKDFFWTDYDIERERGYDIKRVVKQAPCATNRVQIVRRRQNAGSSGDKKNSGGNGDDGSDGEPPRSCQSLLNQNDLAAYLGISKKTLQNLHSSNPHLLPRAISIPGARGPRWTAQAVQNWLDARPAYTTRPVLAPAKNRVSRPRIALAVKKGGAK